MTLNLTDEQTAALIRLLSRAIDDDRYPLSPRVMTLKEILAKLFDRSRYANRHRRCGITNHRGWAGIGNDVRVET